MTHQVWDQVINQLGRTIDAKYGGRAYLLRWLATAIHTDSWVPVLCLHGAVMSGKSTIWQMLQEIIPSWVNVAHRLEHYMPRVDERFVVLVSNDHWSEPQTRKLRKLVHLRPHVRWILESLTSLPFDSRDFTTRIHCLGLDTPWDAKALRTMLNREWSAFYHTLRDHVLPTIPCIDTRDQP